MLSIVLPFQVTECAISDSTVAVFKGQSTILCFIGFSQACLFLFYKQRFSFIFCQWINLCLHPYFTIRILLCHFKINEDEIRMLISKQIILFDNSPNGTQTCCRLRSSINEDEIRMLISKQIILFDNSPNGTQTRCRIRSSSGP